MCFPNSCVYTVNAIFFNFRTMNLNNTLLKQVLERKHEVLCILTEKIVTTKKCLITEHIQTEEKIGGIAGFSTKVVKVKGNCVTHRPFIQVPQIAVSSTTFFILKYLAFLVTF